MAQAHKRLQRELQALQRESPPGIRARPLESDILQWHYCIEGPAGTPYAGGFYHGLVRFPPEYPFKPPAVLMYTPSGRFQTNTRICLSMSDFHPESWNPVWSVASILVGVQSFLVQSEITAGSIESSDADKVAFAQKSLEFNVKNRDFAKLFPELVALRAAAASSSSTSSSSSAGAAGGGAAGPPAAPGVAAATRGNKGEAAGGLGGALTLLAVVGLISLLFIFGNAGGGHGEGGL